MKKWISALIAVIALSLFAFALEGCSGTGPSASPTPTKGALSPVKASSRIVAEGKVVPATSAALGLQTGGIVAKVPVGLGDRVESGSLIAQLDTRVLELQLAQAEANVASAQAKLNLAKRGPTAEDKAAAEQNLASAQAAYDNLVKPNPNDLVAVKADVDKAKAMVDQAQAAYDRAGGDGHPFAGMLPQRAQLQSAWLDYQKAQTAYTSKVNPTNAQVQQALAGIANAKNQLARLQPTSEDIAAAQAGVNAALAARDLAAEQLKNAKMVAPFAGRITTLDVKVGEYVAPGVPLVRLADTSNWQVETTDLTELNIVNVREGDPVVISFDAVPGLELQGKVNRIKGYGENKQGDIVYTLVITLDKQDERLRWNMTAKVNLESQK